MDINRTKNRSSSIGMLDELRKSFNVIPDNDSSLSQNIDLDGEYNFDPYLLMKNDYIQDNDNPPQQEQTGKFNNQFSKKVVDEDHFN